jgi:monoamine oxidase
MIDALPASFARHLRRAAEALRRWKLRSAGAVRDALPRVERTAGAARHIAIIGAGLSGLCAGYLLSEAGQEVTVIEARKQPGGRTLTLREGFAQGLYADAGAARISDAHLRTMAWIEHFGLALEPMYPDAGRLISVRDGRPVAGADAAHLSSHDIHHILTGHIPWEAQWPAARSASQLVRNSLIKPVWHRIKGGMDSLPRAFADRLDGKIRYGAPVTAIKRDSAGVEVHFQEGGTDRRLRADFAVCAVPNTVLRSIHVSPAFPDDKQQIIGQSRSVSATRVFLQLRDRNWLWPYWSGFGVTPDNWEIWQSHFPSTQRCVLSVYAQGEAAVPLAALAPDARIAEAMVRLETLFPGIRERCEAAVQICWDENPWSLGAQQIGSVPLDVATRSEGRVHFAGAHTSATGWMEGALESGYRVAAEILRNGLG